MRNSSLFLVFLLVSTALSDSSKDLDLRDLRSTSSKPPANPGIQNPFPTTTTTWNLTFLAEPPPDIPPRGLPPLHVAHCISGQLRSLYLRSVYTTYKHAVIDSLEAPSKLFVVATAPGLNLPRYDAALAYLDPAAVIHVSKSDVLGSNLMKGSPVTLAARRMFQIVKYVVCFELVRRYERLQDGLFSHVIITRPDVLMRPVGPAREWRHDMFMAPPTEYTHGFREKSPYDFANHTLPVSTVLGESFGDVGFPGSGRYPRRVTEIFNVVPRGVADGLFRCLLRPRLPRDFRGDGTGDRMWFGVLEWCNVSISWHPMEYHLVRDANDPEVMLELQRDMGKRYDRKATAVTPPDAIPEWMMIYRTE